MTTGTHIIFLGTSNSNNLLCLGTELIGEHRICSVARFNPTSDENTWVVVPVPGAEAVGDARSYGVYLQHQKTGLFPRFGDGEAIQLSAFDPSNTENFMRLDWVGDGFVAINNHSADLVMDASGNDPKVGAIVAPHKWNGGNNQKWRFISTVLFAKLSS